MDTNFYSLIFKNLIENLFEIYGKNSNFESKFFSLKKFRLEIYREFKEHNFIRRKFDYLGSFYQENLKSQDKKDLGQFYTPKSIVNKILDNITFRKSLNIMDKKIIDLSCGSGSFLIEIVNRIIERFISKKNLTDPLNLTTEQAKELILFIKKNIYGIDINPIACILCQLNIHIQLMEIYKSISEKDKEFDIPFFNIFNVNALSLSKLKELGVQSDSFDFVIGNPPYIFIRDLSKSLKSIIEKNFETNEGQYDIYQIFIELGIKLLKNQGYLGYIIPDSVLALSNRRAIRKYIFKESKIKKILVCGQKFDSATVSNIILVLRKESRLNKRLNNKIKVTYLNTEREMNIIPQKLLKSWDYKFLINLTENDIEILDYLNSNFTKIKQLIERKDYSIQIGRGVELGKQGKIIYCKQCDKYFPIPNKKWQCRKCKEPLDQEFCEDIIVNQRPSEEEGEFTPYIYTIERYKIKDYKFIILGKKGINYKELEDYGHSILIRQLNQGKKLCATFNAEYALHSQSIYNLTIRASPIPEFNHYYLLGLINSCLIAYYFMKSFGSYKELFPRILIEKINEIPIKVPKTENERDCAVSIAQNVKKILDSRDKKKKNTLQEIIDNLVFKLYEISQRGENYILKTFHN